MDEVKGVQDVVKKYEDELAAKIREIIGDHGSSDTVVDGFTFENVSSTFAKHLLQHGITSNNIEYSLLYSELRKAYSLVIADLDDAIRRINDMKIVAKRLPLQKVE